MNLLKNNFVINLEKRKDRLEHVKKEFKKLNVQFTRFNAIEMKNGGIGCTLSHIGCLEKAIKLNYEHVFICEDDITFLEADSLKKKLEHFYNTVKNWDVLLIAGNIMNKEKEYKKIDDCYIRVTNVQTTTGYIVNQKYFKTLLNNFKEGVEKLSLNYERGRYAIDIHWKKLQRTGNWFIIYPLSVIQYANFSDIENKFVNYESLLQNF